MVVGVRWCFYLQSCMVIVWGRKKKRIICHTAPKGSHLVHREGEVSSLLLRFGVLDLNAIPYPGLLRWYIPASSIAPNTLQHFWYSRPSIFSIATFWFIPGELFFEVESCIPFEQHRRGRMWERARASRASLERHRSVGMTVLHDFESGLRYQASSVVSTKYLHSLLAIGVYFESNRGSERDRVHDRRDVKRWCLVAPFPILKW